MGDFWGHVPALLILLVAAIYTGDTQLQYLNMAIQLYDLLEVIPIY